MSWHQITPLNDEQRRLAGDNVRLVVGFMARRRAIVEWALAWIDADELESDLHFALCKAARGWDPGRRLQFSTYAFRVMEMQLCSAVNVAKRKRRRRWTLSLAGLGDDLPNGANALGREDPPVLEQQDQAAALQRSLGRLHEKHRRILEKLFGLNGQPIVSAAEIAREANRSTQAVYQMRDSAVKSLRAILPHG